MWYCVSARFVGNLPGEYIGVYGSAPLLLNVLYFETLTRIMQRGLAKMETVAGELISFAAGQLADDGEGKHSPFAIALAKRISQKPAIEVRRLFDFVRDDVMYETNKKQQPFTYHSLPARLDFYFNR